MTIKYLDSKRIRGSSTAAVKTILKFTGNGTFTPTEVFSVEYLVVGGGAGAAVANGGGGGAGAFRTASITTAAEAYTVVVGAGSAGVTDGNFPTNGAASSLNSSSLSIVTSDGGGAAGRGGQNAPSYSGNGSGGGAGNGSSGSDGGAYGNNGGDGTANDNAAGGGGSAGNGADGATNGGAGGIGTASSITGSSLYYSGGGGGAAQSGSGGAGGSSVGGAGSSSGSGNNAVANTGSGGGGGTSGTGGNGSAGVVILSFDASKGYSTTGTVAATNTTQDDKTTLVTPATNSITFDGSDDKAEAATASHWGFFNSGNAWSIAWWQKAGSIGVTEQIFNTMNDSSGSNKGINVYQHASNKLGIALFPSAGAGYPFAHELVTGFWADTNWHHIALVYDGTDTLTIYKDGASDGTQTKTGDFTTGTPQNALKLGERVGANNRDSNSSIADMGIWSKELSSANIVSLYNSGNGMLVSGLSGYATNLEAYYPFETNANDSSSNSRNGTVTGATFGTPAWKSASSNLQENTIFNETDTYRQFWLQDGQWIMNSP